MVYDIRSQSHFLDKDKFLYPLGRRQSECWSHPWCGEEKQSNILNCKWIPASPWSVTVLIPTTLTFLQRAGWRLITKQEIRSSDLGSWQRWIAAGQTRGTYWSSNKYSCPQGTTKQDPGFTHYRKVAKLEIGGKIGENWDSVCWELKRGKENLV
jgi:hypothetical protein